MYALVLVLAAAASAASEKNESIEAILQPQLAGGTAVCRPDVRGTEERLIRAFLSGAYWPAGDQRFRCRIA
ncbi:MAG TPA: hypothetical protein VLT59_02000 [Steroidobacteraceae bacterium]|nr:hypothetical protein [Steroidobacteraceae bacterium]